jgi:Spy/CpxP family protein refolding chaperone
MFKRLYLFLCTGALLGAQTGAMPSSGGVQQAVAARMQQMAQELNLTDPQKEKIRPILREEAPKVQAIKEDTSMPRREKFSKMMEVRNETNAKIAPILTPGQQKKFELMRQQNRQQILKELKTAPGPSM